MSCYIQSVVYIFFFFFNDTATTEIYTLSLHDALPIFGSLHSLSDDGRLVGVGRLLHVDADATMRRYLGEMVGMIEGSDRSEEHTSELQSRQYLVCRLLLEKKKKNKHNKTKLYNTPTY